MWAAVNVVIFLAGFGMMVKAKQDDSAENYGALFTFLIGVALMLVAAVSFIAQLIFS